MPFSITQDRTGHHGTRGVPASALMVRKSKLASAAVFPPARADAVEKGAKQRIAQVQKEENTR